MARVGAADRFDGLDAEAVLAAAGRREQWAIADLCRAYPRFGEGARAGLDPRLADGIWDGAVPPDDAPQWAHRVGTLVAIARSPAVTDELEREAEILAEMLAATAEGAPPAAEAPVRRRLSVVGAVAAVKAGAAIVTALGAAAATTGLVVTLMAPKAGPERPPVGTSADTRPAGASESDRCAAPGVDCSATTTAGGGNESQRRGATPDPELPTPSPSPSPSPSSTSPASTSSTAPPTTAALEDEAGSADAPGNSGSAPGRPESPGNSGSAPGRPESPGNSGSGPGRPESPGNSGSAPGRPESPGNSGTHPPPRPAPSEAPGG